MSEQSTSQKETETKVQVADVKEAPKVEPLVQTADVKESKAEVSVKEATKQLETVKYFAIGSMMNPTSLGLREIYPTHSVPGELYGYKLVFQGAAGMGNVEEEKGAVAHGVLHTITPVEMLALDKIEMVYSRKTVDIHLYDGTVEKATVYQFDLAKLKATAPLPYNPPSERYIDIITRGAKHYGVKQEFIDWLGTIKTVPRPDPKDFKKLPEPEDPTATMTVSELAKLTGDDGTDLHLAVNFKVLKFVGDRSNPAVQSSYDWQKARYAAKHITCLMAKILYEPKYPVPSSVHEMSEEHRALIENNFISWSVPGCHKVVAKLVYDDKK
jgi:hypothetical protein